MDDQELFEFATRTLRDERQYLRVPWEPVEGEKQGSFLLEPFEFRTRPSSSLLQTPGYVG
jgi:hypothetical protein